MDLLLVFLGSLLFVGIVISCVMLSCLMQDKQRVARTNKNVLIEEKLPKEKAILDILEEENYDSLSIKALKEVHKLGAKIILTDVKDKVYMSRDIIIPKCIRFIVLTDNALCISIGKSNRYYISPPITPEFSSYAIMEETITTKNKSVVGRAVAGGVLTGGVGAVVGAASAVSNGGTKTVTNHLNTGNRRLTVKVSSIAERFAIDSILVSNELKEKIGVPDLTMCDILPGQLTSSFALKTGKASLPYGIYRTDNIIKFSVSEIRKYFQKAIEEKVSKNEILTLYEELLVSGRITQAEFDAKKKQLLGL